MAEDPPAKRARNGASDLDDLDEFKFMKGSASGLDTKQQAKRIKAKSRNRAKELEKFGEEPIFFDICDLLGKERVEAMIQEGPEVLFADKFRPGHEEQVVIERLSANGNGLAVASSGDWIFSMPLALPGETVIARVHSNERLYSRADVVEVVKEPSSSAARTAAMGVDVKRQDNLVGCKYFGMCMGCQYQNIDYDTQLALKQRVVQRALRNYSHLPPESLPDVKPTLASPKQYGYRTKLTPHFELPVELKREYRDMAVKGNTDRRYSPDQHSSVAIGFDQAGPVKGVLDIEECPIATDAINAAMPAERQRVQQQIRRYKFGATLLFRDSLASLDDPIDDASSVVVTDHKEDVKERVLDTKFLTSANAFFQNNRAAMPYLLAYIHEQLSAHAPSEGERYLVDTYCGSGLFALCLADQFTQVAGIEISTQSIQSAEKNAKLNKATNVRFVAGDATQIFKQINFPADRTTVIIDPPRRGCDEPFIEQLLDLGPQLIVYVSCNVHTQARDVGQIVRGKVASKANGKTASSRPRYEILSIRGADLFPQTHHVEGVCVLRRLGDS